MSRKSMSDLSTRQYRNRLKPLINLACNVSAEATNEVRIRENINDNNMDIDSSAPGLSTFSRDENRETQNINSNDVAEISNVQDIYDILMQSTNNYDEYMLLGEILNDEDNELNVDNTENIENEVNIFAVSEQCDDDDDTNEENEFYNKRSRLNANIPVYRGADITVHESMIAILSVCLKNNLTMKCVDEIIGVVELHCLKDDLQKNSLKILQNYFNLCDTNYKKHFYCIYCNKKVESERSSCETCLIRKISHFIELPVIDHLKSMYKRKGFWDSLQERFEQPNVTEIIRDLYDGQLYKEWVDDGFLSENNKNNISLSWYTDGVPVFSSSKISAWPLYLTINELPFRLRKKKHNTLLLGLWYGDKKPNFNLFINTFRPIFERLRRGIKVQLADDSEIIVKAMLLMGVCDLPAKSECLNFKQFNGVYGCPVCFEEGNVLTLGPRSHVQTYPYTDKFELRTLEKCLAIANVATPNNPLFGIKGHTALSRIMPNFIQGTCIDRMHAVDGGVVKKLLWLFFDKDNKNSPFSLHRHINEVNSYLKDIKPPKFIHRMPRTLNDYIHWKSSELKNFFFYYSVPIFNKIMEQKYFKHYLRLVTGIYILSCDEITWSTIDTAEDLLNRFSKEFAEFYGNKFNSINFHLLRHLANSVRIQGPLWSFTCYEYENLNGEILKSIHGTRYIDSQVANSHTHLIKMDQYLDNVQNVDVRNFCSNKKHQVMINEKISEDAYSVGVYKKLIDIPNIILNALSNSNYQINNVHLWQFFRILKDEKLYVSQEYKRSMQTISSAIKFKNNGDLKMGFIHCFVKYLCCKCFKNACYCNFSHFAIVKEVQSDSVYTAEGDNFDYDSDGFINKCTLTNNVKAVNIDDIITPCIYIVMDKEEFFINPINKKELE